MVRPRLLGTDITTIQITWKQKDRMSVYRKWKITAPPTKPSLQKDQEIFEEILSFYESSHLLVDPKPKSHFRTNNDPMKDIKTT